MKRKKLLYTVYSALFVGICLVPAVTMPLSKGNESAEKRRLAEAPKITTEDGKLNADFFSQFDTYFSEHFGLRQRLVTLDGELRAELTGTSANADVIVGRDGWLYYAPTADDFMHNNVLSDRAVNNICHNLGLMSEFCSRNDAEFLFFAAPNKNSVYPEYMPYNYKVSSQEGNYDKLVRIIGERRDIYMSAYEGSLSPGGDFDATESFGFLDMREVLRSKKADSPVLLYHMTDTHWNNAGALAARNAVLGSLGGKQFDDYSGIVPTITHERLGDLAEMLYPMRPACDEQFNYAADFGYEYVGRFRGLDDVTIKTACEGADGSLLMYRDSYGEAILPFMAESFASAEFSRTVPYRTDAIASGEAKTVVLEIVERNLGNLQKYAPVMAAPERDISALNVSEAECAKFYEDANLYHHIYGLIDESAELGDMDEIYVTVGGRTFEAFNCFEDKLLGMTETVSDRGFSLYIPKEELSMIPDLNSVTVSIRNNDKER